jgi:hypothetical protein
VKVHRRKCRFGQHRCGKSASAKEGDITQIEKSGEADHNVQPHGSGREDQDLSGNRHVGI